MVLHLLKIGSFLNVLVSIFQLYSLSHLRECEQKSVELFENSMIQTPEVIQAQRLFGDLDYFLYVITSDLSAFQQLYDQRLSSLPDVLRLTSTLVMKDLVQDRPFPL